MLRAPGFEFGNRIGQHILVRHAHHRHEPAEHCADLLRTVARSIDDKFATDFALRRLDDPVAALAPDARGRAEADDLRAQVARTLRQCLGQLRRIDVAVIRIVKAAGQIVGLQKRIAVLQTGHGDHRDIQALVLAHADNPFELHHPVARMGKAQRAGDVVVHRIVDPLAQVAIKFRRIALHVHDRPACREGRHIAGGVPGRARGQLVLFQQHAIGPALERQMVEAGSADGAAADDDDTRCRGQVGHGCISRP